MVSRSGAAEGALDIPIIRREGLVTLAGPSALCGVRVLTRRVTILPAKYLAACDKVNYGPVSSGVDRMCREFGAVKII